MLLDTRPIQALQPTRLGILTDPFSIWFPKNLSKKDKFKTPSTFHEPTKKRRAFAHL